MENLRITIVQEISHLYDDYMIFPLNDGRFYRVLFLGDFDEQVDFICNKNNVTYENINEIRSFVQWEANRCEEMRNEQSFSYNFNQIGYERFTQEIEKRNIKDFICLNPEVNIKKIKREQRIKKQPITKFANSIRRLIYNSSKRGTKKFSKNAKTEQILGCTIEEFMCYIAAQFKKGMSFDNHGAWHLDHIIPLASAETKEEILKLNHYTNFQPLWAKENISKGAKIIEKQLVLC